MLKLVIYCSPDLFISPITGLLSALYPQYSSEFYAMVEEVGEARMLQGVHYPSDNDAAMLISAAIWEDIKYDILPDLPTKE